MRTFLMLIVSAAILAGAYVVTFGLPAQVAAIMGSDSAAPETGGAPAGAARGPGRPGGPRGRSGATTVVTTALERQPYDSVLTAIGTASALRSVEVVSDAAGTVIETNLAPNREVEAGEVLVRFDARTQVLNLEIAQAELDQARDTVSRYERLRNTGSATVTDVTLSEARVSQRLAEAAVGLAEVALEDKTIRAPIAGRLGLSDVDVGDALAANAVIATIDQADALLVEFELPERAIGLLARADEVLLSTSTFTGRVFTGTVVSFDSRIDSVTRSVTVKARIDNPEGMLWPGMTFSVRLVQQSDPLPALPATAITWSRSGSSVWIDADGVAQQAPVTILFRRDEMVWIDADIPDGAMIVTEGAQKLREGARLDRAGEDGAGAGGAGGQRGPRNGVRDGSREPARRPGNSPTASGAGDTPADTGATPGRPATAKEPT
ncbi:efflux RND transporter periplasmic adaptor subunit [Pseudooceanicola aestuarii]|uniref:efflux RND transporter periplasmic adaptor subunit n=1 Tax=Pseudooceanicola aestuarii TaxID=2697319 RepID=UPI0013D8BCA5|nr:efflux RND transporter periplasmic adaptor subunit [Pseudooceanicola aestuarii]